MPCSDILQYISLTNEDRENSNEKDYGIFNKTSKTVMTKTIVKLIERICYKKKQSYQKQRVILIMPIV